jgi:hypothetical protein
MQVERPLKISKMKLLYFQMMGRKILGPFRNTKGCHLCRSLLLVWQICPPNWYLDMYTCTASCVQYVSRFDGSAETKYLLLMQAARVRIHEVPFYIFSRWHSWEPRYESGFHISFWDYIFPKVDSRMTLEIYK